MSASGGSKGAVYSRHLRINSDDRKSGTPSDFKISVGSALQNVTSVSFLSVNFSNNMYNIRDDIENSNNRFLVTITDGGDPVTHEITIDPGWYDFGSLTDTLTDAFANIPLTPIDIQWYVDPINQKVRLSMSTAFTSMVIAVSSGMEPDWVFNLLGFDGLSINVSYLVSATATSMPRLGGTPMVYIISAALAPGNAFDESGNQLDVAVAIPVNSEFKSNNFWDCRVDGLCSITYSRPRQLNLIDIRLCDHRDKLINLQGGKLNIELRVWYNHW